VTFQGSGTIIFGSLLGVSSLEIEQIYRVERRRGIIALEGWDASARAALSSA
jgi:hypothetical protein